jgi:hypothetical protein
LLVEVVQPLVDARARKPIKSKGNAFLSGVLKHRFIILIIRFIFAYYAMQESLKVVFLNPRLNPVK